LTRWRPPEGIVKLISHKDVSDLISLQLADLERGRLVVFLGDSGMADIEAVSRKKAPQGFLSPPDHGSWYTGPESPNPEQRVAYSFQCKTCQKAFNSPSKDAQYCSRSCKGRIWTAESLRIACIEAIKKANKYLTKDELTQAVGISPKRLFELGISATEINEVAGGYKLIRAGKCLTATAEEIVQAAKEKAIQLGRFVGSGEMSELLGVSTSKIERSYSTIDLMAGLGFSPPYNIFEGKVYKILSRLFEKIECQKSFDDLKSPKNRPMWYDFWIPKYRVLVEADGDQHYRENNIWNTEGVVERDKLKDEYAIQNNITLVRIPYSNRIDYDAEAIREIMCEATKTRLEWLPTPPESAANSRVDQPSKMGYGSVQSIVAKVGRGRGARFQENEQMVPEIIRLAHEGLSRKDIAEEFTRRGMENWDTQRIHNIVKKRKLILPESQRYYQRGKLTKPKEGVQ